MEFWRFSTTAVDLTQPLPWSYDLRLVFLSFVVATAAAHATLEIIERVKAYGDTRHRLLWTGVGAASMGSGVWAMHYVGMLAYQLPVPVSYGLAWTGASVVPAVVGSGVAIHVLGRTTPGPMRLASAGLSLGLGIGAMHYTGMEAMRVPAVMRYDLVFFLTAVFVACVLATTAFWAERQLGRRLAEERALAFLLSAPVLGAAVCGMHYTAMHASLFYMDPSSPPVSASSFSRFGLSVALLIATSLVALVIVGGTHLDRRLRRALSDLERLREILPMCAWCKRIPDAGQWYDLESYISRRERASFSHGICPECSLRVFGEEPRP
jgi:NO-binding membrane sensor protein with MHYT domain